MRRQPTPTYGYGGPWCYGYGGGFSTTQINYNEYVEGTLFVSLVDKSSEKIYSLMKMRVQKRGNKILALQ